MKASLPSHATTTLLPLLLLSLLTPTITSPTNSTHPKRGLCYITTTHSQSDSSLFTSPRSPLTFYYNYSPYPGPSPSLLSWPTQFVPMIHSASQATSSISTLLQILNGTSGIPISTHNGGSNTITHVLTFNEPDGSTSSGGTSTPATTAAEIWHQYLSPLRLPPYNLKLSLPATTGSPTGLQWLSQFNTSCYALNATHGCVFDFISTHWYGSLPGLQSWLGQLHALYPSRKIWLTEFALPSASAQETEGFMNDSLRWLDGLDYLEKYSWFGAFRSSEANGWTGNEVSLLDGSGKLTGLGASWLGGVGNGFVVGMGASGNGAAGRGWDTDWGLVGLALVVWVGVLGRMW